MALTLVENTSPSLVPLSHTSRCVNEVPSFVAVAVILTALMLFEFPAGLVIVTVAPRRAANNKAANPRLASLYLCFQSIDSSDFLGTCFLQCILKAVQLLAHKSQFFKRELFLSGNSGNQRLPSTIYRHDAADLLFTISGSRMLSSLWPVFHNAMLSHSPEWKVDCS